MDRVLKNVQTHVVSYKVCYLYINRSRVIIENYNNYMRITVRFFYIYVIVITRHSFSENIIFSYILCYS